MLAEITKLRKHLHTHPELSGKETETAKTIVEFLAKYPPDDCWENVGTTGILAFYKAKKTAKKTILFRCELDALPIQEINTFEHKSVTENVSHKCGHDGHMSILCSLAKKLHEQPLNTVNVVLLFQPAEENGEGAVAVYKDERFNKVAPDYVFALHNLPGLPMHEIVVKNGTFTCAVNSIIVDFKGKTAHAGEPENGDNPAMAIAELIQKFQALIQPDISKEDFTLLTPIYVEMGTKDYGISAGSGSVHYTFRRAVNEQMRSLEIELETIAKTTAEKYGLGLEVSWTQRFSANENNSTAVDFVRTAAKNASFQITERTVPFKWGEDFGIFTEHFAGAMFGLGSGENTPALHNPDYDFPDEIAETGAEMFYQIAKAVEYAQ